MQEKLKFINIRSLFTLIIVLLLSLLVYQVLYRNHEQVLATEECACEKGMVELTVRYNGPQNGVTVDVYSKDYPQDHIGHFENVQRDQLLTVYGPNGGRLENTTKYYINGVYNAQFHTSCSEYILNQTHGKFTVTGWKDGKGNICNPQHPPEPYPDSAELCAGGSVAIDVLANDSDPDGNLDPSSVTISSNPSNGIITDINPVTGAITYQPNPGFVGNDFFSYQVCDTDILCGTATVTITVSYCPECGNGTVDPGEECDDGNSNNYDGCRNNCTLPYCGDGIIDPGETCDDGNSNNNDGCRNDCTLPNCGDGILDANEECDPPGDSDLCSSGTCDQDCTCTPPPSCGDNKVDIGEECDPPGNTFQCTYGVCENNCTCPSSPSCGNGVLELGEQCDPPGTSNQCESGVCSGNCTCTPPPSCGDGILNIGEQCDPPGVTAQCASGLCLGNCLCSPPPGCGDGTIDAGEECDPPGALAQCANGACLGNCLCPVPPPTTEATPRVRTKLTEECGLIFGANEFVLSAHASPISSHGIIQFTKDDPQQFYLEAKNANKAKVVNIDTLAEYPLKYNEDLKLWTGELTFSQIGQFRLKAVISNEKCEYEREINSVYIFEKSQLTDSTTDKVITEAIISIYTKDPKSGSFELWSGASYGQTNPFSPYNGEFSVILPRGEYYISVDVPGYNSIRSLITKIDNFSVVGADIEVKPRGSLLDQLISLYTKDYGSNNFPLTVTPMVGMYLMPREEEVPDITLYDAQRKQTSLFNMLSGDKPAVIFVYSSWNTLANEQVEIYQSVRDELGDRYDFIPLTTMEPDNVNKIFLTRGEYDMEFYKPDDVFFHDYFIISLPQFFLIDENKVLKNIITGPYPKEELVRRINLTLEAE
ncbi:DUF4215 domain-containing protein [Candidatus Dojkabacteria bacterium]|nr:DUF4215 domain-containing protein [Candidatus Dojkabacteria bacterium]